MDGDELIPDAGVVLDRHAEFGCAAEALWPWIVQLGKGRAGWYLPGWLEWLVPRRRRSLAVVDPRLQQLRPGDVLPDWGPGDPTFTVVSIDPPRSLVYRSVRPRRRGEPLEFTWALVVEPLGRHGAGCGCACERVRWAGASRDSSLSVPISSTGRRLA